MKEHVNFSPEPFHNHRFVLVIVWCLNVVLMAGLVFSSVQWMRLNQNNRQAHRALAEIAAERHSYQDAVRRAEDAIDEIDRDTYQKQIPEFQAIQSAFHSQWGSLLDDLGSLLGPDVRLVRLESEESLNPQAKTMSMRLDGVCRHKTAELEFIRALQKHPAFENVRFEAEAYRQDRDQAIVFQIQFNYAAREV